MRHPFFQLGSEGFIFGLHLPDSAAGKAVKRFKYAGQKEEAQNSKDQEKNHEDIHVLSSVIFPSY